MALWMMIHWKDSGLLDLAAFEWLHGLFVFCNRDMSAARIASGTVFWCEASISAAAGSGPMFINPSVMQEQKRSSSV